MTGGPNAINGIGFTIPAAARELGVTYKSLQKAIENGQARTVQWGDMERITPWEIARLKAEFGVTATFVPELTDDQIGILYQAFKKRGYLINRPHIKQVFEELRKGESPK